jgi:hypothetical protein
MVTPVFCPETCKPEAAHGGKVIGMLFVRDVATAAYSQNGNVGPTLTWLNLESKQEVDELYRPLERQQCC